MAKKILVVDDEPFIHRLLKHHLERAGYELCNAHNGREAIEVAGHEHPHLIVMDIMMAEMDGISALKELKKSDATRDIPVIMITADGHDELLRAESASSGAALFMTKPFSPAQLLGSIHKLMLDSPAAGTAAV